MTLGAKLIEDCRHEEPLDNQYRNPPLMINVMKGFVLLREALNDEDRHTNTQSTF